MQMMTSARWITEAAITTVPTQKAVSSAAAAPCMPWRPT